MIRLSRELRGTILDVGGGGDGIVGRLYKSQVVAIDTCQEELDEAPDCFQKVLMDAKALDYQEETFDHVTFFYSLMFMDVSTQKQALSEAIRVLKAGGTLRIWDAEISSAYPDPFCVDLEIDLDGETIHTTYGIVSDVKDQTAETFLSICSRYRLALERRELEDGQFYLVFQKLGPASGAAGLS